MNIQITCKNCKSKYSIAKGKIPKNGIKVKCSNCGSVSNFQIDENAVVHRKNIVNIEKIKNHKWITASIIFLLVVSPAAYSYISIKFNKPYNLLMNLSEFSSKEDIIKAVKNISKMTNKKLVYSASEHIDQLNSKVDDLDVDERTIFLSIAVCSFVTKKFQLNTPGMTFDEAEKILLKD